MRSPSEEQPNAHRENKMKTAIVALIAAAAMSLPAMAQDQKANPDANTPPATQNEMNNQQPGQTAGENQVVTQDQTASQEQGGQVQLSSSEVKSIQGKLKSEGFHAGPVDGKFGPETKAALEKFQKKNGLNTTGEPDSKTLAALGINEQSGMEEQNTQTMQKQQSAKAGKPMNQEQNPPENENKAQNQPGTQNQPDQGK
jgi:peptidoglycan hydrolase-like protein with peptidoglycan-binding domain